MGTVKGDQMVLNIGPQHPSTHGVLRLKVVTDGEIVSDIEPIIGYLHRCFEKHCENSTYEQVIPFTDRCDYIASMNNNFGYVVAMEKLMEIKVPDRVEYIRIIMAELNRIASHLLALGVYGLDVGAFTPFLYMFRDRERILDIFELTCGARLLYNYMWVGGVSHDLPVGFVETVYGFLDYFEPKLKEYNEIFSFVQLSVSVLKKSFKANGFNVGFNIGETAGAGIAKHVHMHVVPRWNGDHNLMSVISETRILPESLETSYSTLSGYFTS